MIEASALKDNSQATVDESVTGRLERMFEDCKALCRENDPLLQGQMQIILGLLSDILEAKDPQNHFQHVVEYE